MHFARVVFWITKWLRQFFNWRKEAQPSQVNKLNSILHEVPGAAQNGKWDKRIDSKIENKLGTVIIVSLQKNIRLKMTESELKCVLWLGRAIGYSAGTTKTHNRFDRHACISKIKKRREINQEYAIKIHDPCNFKWRLTNILECMNCPALWLIIIWLWMSTVIQHYKFDFAINNIELLELLRLFFIQSGMESTINWRNTNFDLDFLSPYE